VLAIVLLIAARSWPIVDWWAVHRSPRRRAVGEAATMLLLVAVAATWGDVAGDVRAWLVVGAVFGVGGDVALLDTGETAFMASDCRRSPPVTSRTPWPRSRSGSIRSGCCPVSR
jgi:uncharacterized membrane protein YhhN